MCTHNPEKGECLNLWVMGLLESWAKAARVLVGMEKSWARLPELATAKKDQQNGLGQQAYFFWFLGFGFFF